VAPDASLQRGQSVRGMKNWLLRIVIGGAALFLLAVPGGGG
jgi:hypothetical protein